jgi:hypothetical protein
MGALPPFFHSLTCGATKYGPTCLCKSCESARDATGNSCVLFKGLSKAKSLVLMCTTSDSVRYTYTLPFCIDKWLLSHNLISKALSTLLMHIDRCQLDMTFLLRALLHQPCLLNSNHMLTVNIIPSSFHAVFPGSFQMGFKMVPGV